ncbi:MAG TPA: SDR family oxidoreductase [Frankiaceae bacterium]|jgi:NAD(P)-dependent dehydrogenase (short-subunit alcohol dehydrogenase family)|nr:SDR family oxidoreductase [Frankiaceae bacterium]
MAADLSDHAVLVTGGGTGIGRACAARLAADGAHVTICGRTEDKLKDAVDRIGGKNVRYIVADITQEDSVEQAIAFASEPTGGLSGCVANAGGGGGLAPTSKQDTTEFTRVLELNALGTFLCLKHTLPKLVESGHGSFVGMSSIAGKLVHPYFGGYGAGKAALEQLCRVAADEYGHLNVRVNAIRPGFIATEIMEGIDRDGPIYNSYVENTPLPRLGEPEDVAELARFLIGPESTWITGQVIEVDGGHSLRRGPNFKPFAVPL